MLTILMIFAIPLVAVIGGLLLAALKILRGGGAGGSAGNQEEEAKMIQAIYHDLSRMEGRIEALETLLMERERGGGDE